MSLHLFVGVADRPVQNGDERLRAAELLDGAFQQVGCEQELLGDGLFEVEVLQLQHLGIGAVGRKSRRDPLEPVAAAQPEPFGLPDRRLDLRAVVEHLLADRPQHRRLDAHGARRKQVAAHQRVAAGFDVEIVSRETRFLALRRNVSPDIGLVGRLVGRETRVAGDPVGAVLRTQAAHLGVERRWKKCVQEKVIMLS